MVLMINRFVLLAIHTILLVGCFLAITAANAFAVVSPVNVHTTTRLQLSSASTAESKATLTEETTWKFTLNCYGLPTKQGKRADQLFVLETQFIEEEGYEPPQGCLRQKQSQQEDAEEGGGGSNSKIELVSSRWQLSEDPSERKDGLWVWGLFKEPLYPFLLLQKQRRSHCQEAMEMLSSRSSCMLSSLTIVIETREMLNSAVLL